MKGPIEFREVRDLFCGVITESNSGVLVLGEACYEQCERLGREVHHSQEQGRQKVRPKHCIGHLS